MQLVLAIILHWLDYVSYLFWWDNFGVMKTVFKPKKYPQDYQKSIVCYNNNNALFILTFFIFNSLTTNIFNILKVN